MDKSLNKNVADFEHEGRKYEIDLLLDSAANGFQSYDVFDMTIGKGMCICNFTMEEGDYMPFELIKKAKEEMNNYIG